MLDYHPSGDQRRSTARTLNVLFVIHSPVFAGPHNQAVRLAPALEANDIRTIVMVPREPGTAAGRLRAAGIEVIESDMPRVRATPDPRVQLRFAAGFMPQVRAIRRVIRERAIDLVQVGGLVNPHAGIAARLQGVPIVWQVLDTRAPAVVAFGAMLLVRSLATVVMPTGIRVLSLVPGGEAVRSRAVPFVPPVDTDAFRPRPELRNDVRRAWAIPPDAPVIGAVANINPQKGIDSLVRAFAAVRRSLPGTRLVLVGSEHASHRAYARRVHALIRELGLAEDSDVVFTGPRDDVDRQIQGFDLLALSSVPRSEGIPTVVLEAMASGVPVVATNVGGVSEVVSDGIDGRVVEPGEPAALSAAILEVLVDPALRDRLGRAARARAERDFTVEACAAAHLTAYAAALRRPLPRAGSVARG